MSDELSHPQIPAAERPSAAHAEQPRGFILWFTGMSGSGKSTLSTAVRRRLEGAHSVEVLDGDEVRTFLSRGLGFTRPDREENIRRIGYVARVLARHRVAVISRPSPPTATRATRCGGWPWRRASPSSRCTRRPACKCSSTAT